MADATAPDYCTVSKDYRTFCGNTCIPDAPIPICYEHAGDLLAFMRDAFDEIVNNLGNIGVRYLAHMSSSIERQAQVRRELKESAGVVYYVRVGDLIKIGTTTNLKARVASYPPGSQLLATERGGLDVEAARLAQFDGCLAAGKEWFMPSPRLLAHIESLKQPAA